MSSELFPIESFNPLRQSDFSSAVSSTGDEPAAYGLGSVSLSQANAVSAPDLVAIAFDSAIDHVLGGQTTVNFLLQNQGSQNAANFDVDIVYSDDNILGNGEDLVVRTISIAGLAAGETLSQTVSLQLPLGQLNANAIAEDPVGQPSGYVSLNRDFLGVVIDPENAIIEANEANNQNQGKGQDKDDVAYFPWDTDDNGQVTPTDAIFVINRLGQTVDESNAKADFDGNGLITPTDAISVINRLGYSINSEVSAPAIAAKLTKDTGPSATDSITSEAAIQGIVADFTNVTTLQAKVEGATKAQFTDITASLDANGRFELTPTQLSNIFGDRLPNGTQTLALQTLDAAGTVNSEFQLSLQLDTNRPTVSFSASPPGTVPSVDASFSEAVSDAAFEAGSYTLQADDGSTVDIASVTRLSATRARLILEDILLEGSYQFSIASAVSDIAGNSVPETASFDFTDTSQVRITKISPNNGEEMVTLTREAIIRFSQPVDPTTVTQDALKVVTLGKEVSGRIVVSSTEKFATFYPDEPWNPSTEVRIQIDGSKIIGRNGKALDADNNGTPGGLITADFRTLPITRIPGTDVFGYVYDSYNKNPDGSDIPLQGVEIRLDALPGVVGVTDENGYFILEDVPAPEFYVYIDGSKVAGLPEGSQYASLGKAFHSMPGRATQLFMDGEPFDVYLPLMAADDVVALSATEDTAVGFGAGAQAFLAQQFPDIDSAVWQQTQVKFVAGSAQDDQGNAATQAMIVPVAPDRLPAPLPPNITPSLVISIQSGGPNGFNREADGGATNFDVPAPIQFSNLEGLAPGEKSLIWTFNHDAGDWEVIGTGTVSEDGLAVVSDEGVGIRAPGWHFMNSGVVTEGGAVVGDDLPMPSPISPDTDNDDDDDDEYDNFEITLKTFIPSPIASIVPELVLDIAKVAPLAFLLSEPPNAEAFLIAEAIAYLFPVLGGDGRGFDFESKKYRSFQQAFVTADPETDGKLIEPEKQWGSSSAYFNFLAESVQGQPFWWWDLENSETKPLFSDTLQPTTNNNNVITARKGSTVETDFKLSGAVPFPQPIEISGTFAAGVEVLLNEALTALINAIPDEDLENLTGQDGATLTKDIVEKLSREVRESLYGQIISIAPRIDADIKVSIRQEAGKEAQYAVSGKHDGFPAYELYIDGMLAYSHDPVLAGKTPWDLLGAYDVRPYSNWRNISSLRPAAIDVSARTVAESVVEEDTFSLKSVESITTPDFSPIEQIEAHHYALYNINSGEVEQRGVSNVGLDFKNLVLAPNTPYVLSVLQPETKWVGSINFVTPGSGIGFTTDEVVISQLDTGDSDNDGLGDIAELVLGTNADVADTDGDGIGDLAEFEQGLDPLGDFSFPTGLIASLSLPGESKAITVAKISDSQRAYIATGSHGLSITETSQFDAPILLGQIDLAGNATDVAVDSSLVIAAIATNNGGLQLVDVSDPMLPKLQETVNVLANQVEIFQNSAYVTSGTTLSAIDLTSGDTLQSLTLTGPGTVTDLFRENDKLYAFTSGSNIFSVIDISKEGKAKVIGQLNVSIASSEVGVFAANGVAYLAGSGLRTIDISDPTDPTLISDAESFFTARDVALNGSGLALVASENQGLAVYGATNPEDTDNFITLFDTPGFVNDIAIASGIAYVADGASGLQVINYRSFDNKSQPPTVTISTTADADPNTDGIQISEGDKVLIQATVLDDVQVRNAELLVNGEVVSNDASFPFDFSTVVPNITPEVSTFTVQVRATDTGGNVGVSEVITLNIIPDTIAPTIVNSEPANGGVSGVGRETVRIRFSEAISEESFDLSTFQLFDGNNNLLKALKVELRNDGKLVQLTYNPLEVGIYRLSIDANDVVDLAGNTLDSQPIASQFSIVEATNFWVGGSGFWDDPDNWSTGEVPNADDIVLIDTPNEATVTFRSGDINIGKFTSREKVVITGGTLNFTEDAEFLNGLAITGRVTLSGSGSILVEGDSEWTSDSLNIAAANGLTNAGVLSISSSTLGRQELSGTLNNAGTIINSGTTNIYLRNGTINNLEEGIYEFQAGSNILRIFSENNAFNNSGIFRKTGTGRAFVRIAFNNSSDGTIDVQEGSLSLIGGGNSQGATYKLANDSELQISNGGRELNYSGDHIVSDDGTLQLFGSRFTVLEGRTLKFDVEDRGKIQFDQNTIFDVEGSLELSNVELGGTFNGSGNITLVGDNDWSNRTRRLSINATNGLTNLGSLSISGGGTHNLSGLLNNAGTIVSSEGATVYFNNATINNLQGATYELQSGNIRKSNTSGSTATINNSGTFLKTGDSAVLVIADFNNLNGGVVSIQEGTIRFSQDYTQTGGTTVLNGGTLNSGNTIDIKDGILTGFGNVNADVLNSGTLRPGISIGTLAINGNYTQTSTGVLNIEISGITPITQFDLLDVQGATELDGILDVGLIDGFVPTTDDSFDILTFRSLEGEFSLTKGSEIGNGMSFDLLYETDRTSLFPT